MKSPFSFILSPIGEQYKNTTKVSGVDLVVNTSLDLAKYVNRIALVVELPIYYNGSISVGDVVVVHHNIFRTYHDMKGRQTKSPEFFRGNLYIVNPDRIYLYKSKGIWKSHLNYCFVKPIAKIQSSVIHSVDKEEKHIGVIVYPSKQQEDNLNLKSGSFVAFTKNSEYEFEVDGEKIYRMYDRDVVIELSKI